MNLIVGFFLLGFLVGDMAGLTSESVVTKLIALLFALFGGSVVLLFQKFSAEERSQIGGLIASIAVGVLLGVHMGILTTQYRWLSPARTIPVAEVSAPAPAPAQAGAPRQEEVAPAMPPMAKVQAPSAPAKTADGTPTSAADSYYLRKALVSGGALIDSQLKAGIIKPEEAYRQLSTLVKGLAK